jgi:hypothetical protein
MDADDLLEPGERINSAKEFETHFDGIAHVGFLRS